MATTVKKGVPYRGAWIQITPDAGACRWMFRRRRFDTYGMGRHDTPQQALDGAKAAIDEGLSWEGAQ